jgi:hypothetical protein
MAAGVQAFDVAQIRDAANRAKNLATMVTPDNSARLQKAIDAARSAARQLVKAGETAARELDTRALRAITEGRTAFLDLDGEQDVQAPTMTGRAIDMDAEPQQQPAQVKATALEIDEEPATIQASAPASPQLELI